MPLWRIKAYYLAGGTCPIRDWYRPQDAEVKAEFDVTLLTLMATSDWRDTNAFGEMKREHVGLGEMRFQIGKKPDLRRFRPVGIWPPTVAGEFILLTGCEKARNGILIPDDAFTMALEYKRRWENGEGEVHDYV